MLARRRFVVDADLAEADPARHPFEKAIALRHLPQRRRSTRRQQAEITGVFRNFVARSPIDQCVEPSNARPAQPGLIFAVHLCSVDDVVAVIEPARDQRLDQVGGCWPSPSMNSTAPGRAWSRPARRAASLPKLRDKRDDLNVDRHGGQGFGDVTGVVAAAVVDVDDFDAQAALVLQ